MSKQLKELLTPVKIGDSLIEPKDQVRNLGVLFDSVCDLEKHVNNICKGAYYQIRNIGMIRKYLDTDATKMLVNAYVTSRLDYCNSLLYGLPKTLINKLQRVQNTAARLITKSKKADHITPVLKDLHWLRIEERIKFKILLLAYKAQHGQAPKYIEDLITPYAPRGYHLRSKESHLLEDKSRTRLKKYGDRTFKKSAAVLWNTLPQQLRKAPTVGTFKSQLKTHLFTLSYN